MEGEANQVVIRTAGEADLPAILEIYNDAILHTTAVYDYEPHTLEMRRDWFRGKQQGGIPVFVAEINAEIAGFSSYGPFRSWAAYQYTMENLVYISPAFRGLGLGQKLTLAVIEAAREKGVHTLVAGIDATNLPSLKLHAKLGFREVARFEQVGYKFEKWLDLVFMQLIFETPAPNA
ncbi:MAG: GNAT family N-acetyltransferase [Bacteroidota bacterium]